MAARMQLSPAAVRTASSPPVARMRASVQAASPRRASPAARLARPASPLPGRLVGRTRAAPVMATAAAEESSPPARPESIFGFSTFSQILNNQKGLTLPACVAMMAYYNNWGLAPVLYTALHGAYGILWVIKDCTFPDKNFHRPIGGPAEGVALAVMLSLYWLAPWLITSRPALANPPPALVGAAVFSYVIGVFLHFAGDAQKHTALAAMKPGELLSGGLFARCRNTNYLGEILIYSAFALLAQHWVPWAVNMFFWTVVFTPGILKKEASLAKKAGWAEYKKRSGLLLPKLF